MFIVHTESSLGWGGQEIRVLTESRELIKHGHRVLLLADPESLISKRAENYGIPVRNLPLQKKRMTELLGMIKAIKELQPDIISTHSSTDHWICAIARLFFKRSPKIVRTRHISAPVSNNPPTRWLYRRGCEAIVTTGESIRINLIKNNFIKPEKIVSIPTGIDLSFYKRKSKTVSRERIQRTLPISLDSTIFGNIATLRSWKGHHDLIKAFSLVVKEIPSCQLLIVGDGPQEGSLKTLTKKLGLEDRVFFPGYQADVRDFFDAIDVFMFPSYANEGVPQAILQAMAYELPIVTTRAGAIEEAVEGYSSVTFVTERRIDEIAKAMILSRRDAGLQTLPSDQIYGRISLDRMTIQVIKVYDTVGHVGD